MQLPEMGALASLVWELQGRPGRPGWLAGWRNAASPLRMARRWGTLPAMPQALRLVQGSGASAAVIFWGFLGDSAAGSLWRLLKPSSGYGRAGI